MPLLLLAVPVVKGFVTCVPVVVALWAVVTLTGTWTARGLPWYGPASLGIAAAELARPTRQRPRILVICMMEGKNEIWINGLRIYDLVDLTRRIGRMLIRVWSWSLMLWRRGDRP